MDGVGVERAGVLEDDRTNGRVPPPFPGLLILLARRAQRVERVLPPRAERIHWQPVPLRTSGGARRRFKRPGIRASSSAQEMASRNDSSSQPEPRFGGLQQVPQRVDLLLQLRLTLADRLELLVYRLPFARASRRFLARSPAACSAASSAVECRRSSRRGETSFQDGGEAARAARGSSRSSRPAPSARGPPAAGRRRSSGSDLGCALELAVDAAVALLHAAGVPRHVEVEEVAQWFCRLTPSRAASVAIRMRSGCVAGSVLKARLISSRVSSPMSPRLEGGDALVGAVRAVNGSAELLLEIALRVGRTR